MMAEVPFSVSPPVSNGVEKEKVYEI